MKRTSIFLFLLIGLANNLFPQTSFVNSILWGNDKIIYDRDPQGTFSGIQDSDGKIYIAIKNKVMFPNGGILVMFSDDLGNTWKGTLNDAWLTETGSYGDFKLVQGPNNSIYLFAIVDNMIVVKRIDEPGGIWASQALASEFDVAFSEATNTFYLLYVHTSDNTLYYRQIEYRDGLFSSLAFSAIYIGTYSPKIVADGKRIGIAYRMNHYLPKENSPIIYIVGEIGENGSWGASAAVNAAPENVVKTEYKCALNGEKVWIVYTENVGNLISLKGTFSTNGGYAFSVPISIAVIPTTNNYWPNIKKNKSGFDLTYYYDEPQAGAATNTTDKIVYNFNAANNSSQFIYNMSVSSNPPFWTATNPIPEVVPLPFSSNYDVGVIWLGWDGSGVKLFWNRFNSVTEIKSESAIPVEFILYQNYPNPFNPSTTISYQLPTPGYVTLKVYDVLGREVATLVDEYQVAGIYNSKFTAQNYGLTSGVYFYSLKSGNYVQTNKMILVK